MSVKQDVLKVISKMNEDVTVEEVMYRLYVIESIHRGLMAVQEGRVKTQDELMREVASW